MNFFKNLFLLGFLLLHASFGFAWGGRGHDAICEAAVFLVQEPNLRTFLKSRSHIMGHLCNIPDTYWRNISPNISKTGGPTHYIDPEVLNMPIKDIPADYQQIVDKFSGAENALEKNKKIISVPEEFGSVWWRANQIFNLAAKSPGKLVPPGNSKEEQDDSFAYNVYVHQFLIYMGVLGHFVGDASQPFHSTADYDGYLAGHGGIHSFYEEAVVSEMDGDLVAKILKTARTNKTKQLPRFLTATTTIENMRELSYQSALEIPTVLKKDVLLQKSELKNEKGMKIKTIAKRKAPKDYLAAFTPLILNQMSRSSLLLAHLWDRAYEKAGKPDLKAYRSYRFPFTPDFIEPDYYKENKK